MSIRTPGRATAAVRSRWRRLAHDAGMSTAEYAIGTVAAAGFAALLYVIVRSDTVMGALTALVQRALSTIKIPT